MQVVFCLAQDACISSIEDQICCRYAKQLAASLSSFTAQACYCYMHKQSLASSPTCKACFQHDPCFDYHPISMGGQCQALLHVHHAES